MWWGWAMKEKSKPLVSDISYAVEPWRCSSCNIFVYCIGYIDGDWYPIAGASQSKYISITYPKVCNICYDLYHAVIESDYWKKVQDAENTKIRKLRSGSDYLSA
jgi:hypothetical protein